MKRSPGISFHSRPAHAAHRRESIDPGNPQGGPGIEWQIVGVFHDIRDGLRNEIAPVVYLPFWQSPWPRTSVGVRTTADPERITRSLATAINSVDPDLPVAGVRTMEQMLDETLSFDRLAWCCMAASPRWPCCSRALAFMA